jgi:hypothetical protein
MIAMPVQVATYIMEMRGSDPICKYLLVRKRAGSVDYQGVPFDTSVCTKNRLFRIPFSTKVGSDAALIPTYRLGLQRVSLLRSSWIRMKGHH